MSTLQVNTIKPYTGTTVAVSGTLDVSGTIKAYAMETITVSETTYLGSNKFGNSSGDYHQFTGSIVLSGSGATLTAGSGSASTLTLKADGGDDGVDKATLSVADGGALTLSGSTDIILDADGANITFKDGGTTYLDFIRCQLSGNCILSSSVDTKDIIFHGDDATEVCRIDGSAKSLLIASGKKIEFADTGEYITSDATNLTIASGGDIVLNPAGGDVLPNADNTRNLGSSAYRWANVYTGDLHLKNDRGDWTILEEEDYLCVVNNATGKKYKMMLQEIDD